MNDANARPAPPHAGSFEAVLATELDIIRRHRRAAENVGEQQESQASASVEDQAQVLGLAGLAFSGGGIRSATFNLRFIQGLANHKALAIFHVVRGRMHRQACRPNSDVKQE